MYTVYIKFISNSDFEIHKIEKQNGEILETEHKVFALNSKGRLPKDSLVWISSILNIEPIKLEIHVEEII